MNLRDFLKTFNVHAPYYLSELHNGVGQKFLIYNDDYIRNEKKDSKWMSSDVIGLDVSVHSGLGSLLVVKINV